MKIFGNGQGGKHRDTREAQTWRKATRAVADAISTQHPEMPRVIVLLHAEDETALHMRTVARQAA